MLFTKKKTFAISEKQIKEELKDENGAVLVKLNLRFPELQCPKKDPLLKHAEPLYRKLADGFKQYAETELFKTAQAAKQAFGDSFKPFSAVSRFEKTFENDRYISFLIDISVSNGIASASTERKTQVWDRKTGMLCRLSDLMSKKQEKELTESLGKDSKKHFDRHLFTLRESGIEFYLRDGESFKAVIIPFEAVGC